MSGLQIFSSNQSAFIESLKVQGFTQGSCEKTQSFFRVFEIFLRETKRLNSSDIFSISVIDIFFQWKSENANYKPFKRYYCSTIRYEIGLLLKWYLSRSNDAIYDRCQFSLATTQYLETKSHRPSQWSKSILRISRRFSEYAERNKIKDLRKISDDRVNIFISECAGRSRTSRKNYSKQRESLFRYTIIKYFYYLNSREIIVFQAPVPAHEHTKLGALIDQYINYCRDHRGDKLNTIRRKRRILGKFDHYITHSAISVPAEIKIIHIDTFTTTYFPSEQKKTIIEVNAVLRPFLRYLYFEKQMPSNLSALIVSPRVYAMAHIPKFLTHDEIRPILQEELSNKSKLRRQAIVRLIFFTGIRASEVASLHFDDIDWEKKQAVIRDRKNAQDMIVVLPDPVIEVLYDYIRIARPQHCPDRHLFYSGHAPLRPLTPKAVGLIVSYALQDHGMKGNPHRLRHTYAQNLLDSGSSIDQIQVLLGHKNASSTRIYAKTSMLRMRQYVVDNYV
ncbi:MAG: hypothetical protein A2X86_12870 [Bdellovibrionales bacterium GWA2_49_15]|nr:MAG: hypothetical protein A2X86_12870 [Bdellovibrionales bacterium GWA2_49_15]HAZ13877.1 hypothetical protein [Bdellovibrionales bacterium]